MQAYTSSTHIITSEVIVCIDIILSYEYGKFVLVFPLAYLCNFYETYIYTHNPDYLLKVQLWGLELYKEIKGINCSWPLNCTFTNICNLP